jgi:hypothetical protein
VSDAWGGSWGESWGKSWGRIKSTGRKWAGMVWPQAGPPSQPRDEEEAIAAALALVMIIDAEEETWAT